MTEALFEVDDPDPGREHQACDHCLTGAWASNDGLRARGWVAYDGTSHTGKALKVRLCPRCRTRK